jgi:hypothetical protein
MIRESDHRALVGVSGLITTALFTVLVLTTGVAIVDRHGIGFAYVIELLPGAVTRMLADAHMLAFMAGPAALMLLFARGWVGGPARITVRPAEATLLALLSATVVVTSGSAVVVTMTARMSEGVRLTEVGVSSLEPLIYAGVVIAACLVVVAAMTIRAGREEGAGADVHATRMSARLAVALSGVVCFTLVAVDLLLQTFYRALESLLSLYDPTRPALGSLTDTIALFTNTQGLAFAGGAVLTFFLVLAGVMTWRLSRDRTPHPILTWASGTALVIVTVGSLWHTGKASAILDAYQQLP